MGAKAGFLPFPKSFETTLLHHGQEASQWSSKSIVPPIITSTIFQVDNPEKPEVGKNIFLLLSYINFLVQGITIPPVTESANCDLLIIHSFNF